MKDFKVWIVLLALPAVGFTNCSYFSDVTVPAVDTSKPAVGSRVYEPGEPDAIHFGSVSYETHDPNGQWIFAPFGYDSGGVQMLSVGTYEDRRCCQNSNPNICAWITSLTQTFIDSESANVGDTVSNGRYDLLSFTPKTSFSGTTCDLHRFGYIVQAMDFAGYLSSGSGSITYTPPPPPSGGGGGFPPLVGGTGGGDNCDEEGTCYAVPDGCQSTFQVQGTWECINGNNKCIVPPEGVPGSYCNGHDDGACGRGTYEDGWHYGESCVVGQCKPATKCLSGADLDHGYAACAKIPACGEPPQCWFVDQSAAVCSQDDLF